MFIFVVYGGKIFKSLFDVIKNVIFCGLDLVGVIKIGEYCFVMMFKVRIARGYVGL